MAKRGSFSISAAQHQRLRDHCKAIGIKVGPFLEERLDLYFDGLRSAAPTPTTGQRLEAIEGRLDDLEFRATDVP